MRPVVLGLAVLVWLCATRAFADPEREAVKLRRGDRQEVKYKGIIQCDDREVVYVEAVGDKTYLIAAKEGRTDCGILTWKLKMPTRILNVTVLPST
jgi:hypothetical protein